MDRMDVHSLTEMRDLKELDFSKRVLIPLLMKLGYREVFPWHGSGGELGKDIVCWEVDRLQHRRNLALVVKADRVTGNAAKSEVRGQVGQAFNSGYGDPSTGIHQQVNECWIVTNKKMGKEARDGLRSMLGPLLSPRVTILDGSEVWEKVQEQFPVKLSQQLSEVQRRIADAHLPYATQIVIGNVERPIARLEMDGRSVVIGEQYEGQLGSELSNFAVKLNFGEGSDGETSAGAFQEALSGDQSIVVSGDQIREFVLPEPLLKIAEETFGVRPETFSSLKMTPLNDRARFVVSIEIRCDDGDAATLPYVDLNENHRTSSQLILDNKEQPLPIEVTLCLDIKEMRIRINFKRREGVTTPPLLLQLLALLRCSAKPGDIKIALVNLGVTMQVFRSAGKELPQIPAEELALISDLADVQERTNQPILIPSRDLTDQEQKAVSLLRRLLKSPYDAGTWDRLEAEFLWNAREGEEMANLFTQGEGRRLTMTEPRSVHLFDNEIPLGRVRQVLERLVVEDVGNLWEQGSELGEDQGAVTVVFVPGQSNREVARYLDLGGEFIRRREYGETERLQVAPCQSHGSCVSAES